MTKRAWQVVGLLGCVLVLALLIVDSKAPSALAFVAACVQVGGAAMITQGYSQRREARFLVFFLLCLAVWAVGSGIVSSLAFSAALALFVGFLNLIRPPVTISRRVATFGAFAFDTVAAVFSLLQPPDAWRWLNLLALDGSVVLCCCLAVVSSPDRRRPAVMIVLPVIALAVAMAIEDASALLGCFFATRAAIGLVQAAIGLTIPLGIVLGLRSRPGIR